MMCDCLAWHPLWSAIAREARVRRPTVLLTVLYLREAPEVPMARAAVTISEVVGRPVALIERMLMALRDHDVVAADNRLLGEWAKREVVPDVMPNGITRSATRDRDTQRMAEWRTRMGLSTAAWLRLRAAVFERDAHGCCECGARDRLHCDHIIELADGGNTTIGNLQTLCQSCHSRKTRRMQTARAAPQHVMPGVDVMPPPSKEEDQDNLIFPSDVRDQARDALVGGYGTQAEAAKKARAEKWLANTLIGAQERLSHDRFTKLYAAAYAEPRPKWAQLELDRVSGLIKQSRQARDPPAAPQGWIKLPIDGGTPASGVTEEERLRRYRERVRSA